MKKKVVFLTGAGMSVESGFKTFRGQDGLWENEPVERIATHEGWLREPDFVNQFYNNMRRKLYAAQPNEGHRLIAEMEREYDVTVVTQNVDNLHERAGSSHIIHLHGELAKVCSSRDQFDERYVRELTEDDCEVKPGQKSADGSLERPFIVFFGEAVPNISIAAEAVGKADVFVIIGTSLNVYPAAGLLQFVPTGKPIFLIDPNPVTTCAAQHVEVISKGASEGMRELTERLRSL
ncbi:MAG: NAD-dependent deacylase [Prevotella sp.]|nr:NAD-dependent deacylase [Prevotella sp.]